MTSTALQTPPSKSKNIDDLIYKLKHVVGVPNVYYEPPENFKMKYPCVRFQRKRFETSPADNRNYIINESVEAVLIYRTPDSPLPRRMLEIPQCAHDRHYTADNLSHDVYTIYI